MKNKIVLIIFLPKFLISGAGNSVFRLIQGLNKKKYILYVLCFGKCEYSKKLTKNVKLFELKYKRLINAFFRIHEIVKKIEKNHKKEKLIFLSNHHYVNIFALTIKLHFKKIKVIGVERTAIHELNIFYSIKDFLKKRMLLFCVKYFYKYLDKIISNSKNVKNEINKFSKKNSMVIYPPSLENFYPKKKNKNNLRKKINILMVGRLDNEKGIKTALEAISYLNYKIILTIIGRGSFFQKKELLSYNFNSNRLVLLGHKNNLKKYYQNADLFLNTSYFEGFSNALIEALNYEVPVIAADCPGGNSEILKQGKFGQLFETNNPNDLSIKIENFLKNKNLFKKKTLLGKRSLKRFTVSKNIHEYSKLFENI